MVITSCHSRCFISLLFFSPHLMSPLILFLFLCSLVYSSFLWKVEISSIQVIYTLFVSSPGWNKGNAMLLLFYVICVGLFSALRSGALFSTSHITPQVSNMCICTWWVFNKCSWLIYWRFSIARKQCHILLQRGYRVLSKVFEEIFEVEGKSLRNSEM